MEMQKNRIYVIWTSYSHETGKSHAGILEYLDYFEAGKDIANRIDMAASGATGFGVKSVIETDEFGSGQEISLIRFNAFVSEEFDKLYPSGKTAEGVMI